MAQMRARSVAELIRVVDGDTVILWMRCPCCGVGSQQRVRLARIDAPELDAVPNTEGLRARDALISLLSVATIEVYVRRAWQDLYGRVIAEVFANGQNASDYMLQAGLAVPYEERERRSGPYSPAGPHYRGGVLR